MRDPWKTRRVARSVMERLFKGCRVKATKQRRRRRRNAVTPSVEPETAAGTNELMTGITLMIPGVLLKSRMDAEQRSRGLV